jgi:uncharacterized membrane protein YbhN (UPF0104 family)
VLSTILNYLPGHGGALFRIQALRRNVGNYRQPFWAILAIGLIWLGLAFLAAGIWLVFAGQEWVGSLFVAIAIPVLIAAGHITFRASPTTDADAGWFALAALAECASIAVLAGRYLLILHAIGAPTHLAAALTLALSSVIAAASGVMPGGLGIRELVASALGPIAGVAAPIAFLVTVVDRLIDLAATTVVAIPLVEVRVTANRTAGSLHNPNEGKEQ